MARDKIEGLRVAFLGLECAFSRPPLEALIRAGARLELVAVPGEGDGVNLQPLKGRLPLAATESILETAWRSNIPIAAIGRFDDRAVDLVRRADVGVVACFTKKLPVAVLEAPAHGWVNLHPSLLPRHRGPNPVFWTFRDDEPETGVTLHRMTGRIDAGPILAQEAGVRTATYSHGEVERTLAELGARLLPGVLRDLTRTGDSAGTPQDEAAATAEPAPAEDDFRIDPAWAAGRIFRFARGMSDWGYAWIEALGRRWFVLDGVSHNPAPAADAMTLDGRYLVLSNAGGTARLRVQER